MRIVLVSVFLTCLVSACGDGVDRWSGSGCQPACVRVPIEGDDSTHERSMCLDNDNGSRSCLEDGITNVVCENAGDVVTCDTDDGKPRCLGGPIERPVCSR